MGKVSDANVSGAPAAAGSTSVENASWTGNGNSTHSSAKMCVDVMADLWSKKMNDDPARFKREMTDLLFDDHSKPVTNQDLNDAWKNQIKAQFTRLNKPAADADAWLTNFEVTNHCE
jgi:hypothetical protein